MPTKLGENVSESNESTGSQAPVPTPKGPDADAPASPDSGGLPAGTLNAFGMTDVGRKRKNNQDQFLIAELHKSMRVCESSLPEFANSDLFGGSRGQLLVVADGMGGHAAGGRASSVALDHLIGQFLNRMHWFLETDRTVDPDSEAQYTDALKTMLHDVHAKILAESASNQSHRGMGTTLTMAHIVWPVAYIIHAGDSRCYRIRQGICEQLTTDHTLARQMVEAGGLLPEEEAGSRWSNVLWNVLGGSGEKVLNVDLSRHDLVDGDTLLLCSDGLSRYLTTAIIGEVVQENPTDVQTICHRMISMANAAGGEDNITVVASTLRAPRPVQVSDISSSPLSPSWIVDESSEESDLTSSQTSRMSLERFADVDTLPETD